MITFSAVSDRKSVGFTIDAEFEPHVFCLFSSYAFSIDFPGNFLSIISL